jgi:hypothetical protein
LDFLDFRVFLGLRRLAAECPLDRYLPTGVAQSRPLGPPQGCDEKARNIFGRARARQHFAHKLLAAVLTLE